MNLAGLFSGLNNNNDSFLGNNKSLFILAVLIIIIFGFGYGFNGFSGYGGAGFPAGQSEYQEYGFQNIRKKEKRKHRRHHQSNDDREEYNKKPIEQENMPYDLGMPPPGGGMTTPGMPPSDMGGVPQMPFFN